MKPLIHHSVESYRKWKSLNKNQTIGFVPTMGALHAGHSSLLQKARAENDLVVLSIFVNPTQFNDKSDLEKYPRTWESDLVIAEQNGVDCVFAPESQEIYKDHYQFQIIENQFSKELCGKNRPGHFEGVLTVVMKLFQIIQPHRVYFGEKDFQQLKLIQNMIDAFFLPVELVPVETVRENDGLAMSSRNIRLGPVERKNASSIFKSIKTAKSADEAKKLLSGLGFEVDYVEDKFNRRFVAAKLGSVRLIDNVKL